MDFAAGQLLSGRERVELDTGGRLLTRGGLGQLVDERAQRQRHVGDDRVAHRRARGLVGIAGDRDQLGASWEEVTGDVGVVREHRGAGDEHQVVARERLGERRDGRRQDALEGRVILGEADPAAAGRRRGPHGQPLGLDQLDRRAPTAGGIDVGAGDEHGPLGSAQALGHGDDLLRVRLRAAADGARDLAEIVDRLDLGGPIIHRDRYERRTSGRQRRVVDRLRERKWHVGGARRLVAPLHVRLGHLDRVAVGERRPHRDQ